MRPLHAVQWEVGADHVNHYGAYRPQHSFTEGNRRRWLLYRGNDGENWSDEMNGLHHWLKILVLLILLLLPQAPTTMPSNKQRSANDNGHCAWFVVWFWCGILQHHLASDGQRPDTLTRPISSTCKLILQLSRQIR